MTLKSLNKKTKFRRLRATRLIAITASRQGDPYRLQPLTTGGHGDFLVDAEGRTFGETYKIKFANKGERIMNHIDVMGKIAENRYNFHTKKKEAQFFLVTAFGKKAEVISEHFHKGDKIKVGGAYGFCLLYR